MILLTTNPSMSLGNDLTETGVASGPDTYHYGRGPGFEAWAAGHGYFMVSFGDDRS